MTLGNTIRSIKNIVTKNETQKLNDFNENLKYLVNYNQLKINEILSTDATQKINAKLHYSISEIKKKFNETLFGVLSSNSYKHISLDSNLLDIIRNIGDNIDQIIPNLETKINDIKFYDPIKINDKEITGTGNPIDGRNSIEDIEENEENLKKLEKIIPNLETRFKNNINTLKEISKHQEAIEKSQPAIFIGSSTETPENDDKNKEDIKSHQESLKQLRAQLEKNQIEIPYGFLPFQSSDTVAGETESLLYTKRKIEDFENYQKQLENFNNKIKYIQKRYKENKDKLKRLLELQEFKKIITQNKRKNEIDSIIQIGQDLDLGDRNYTSRVQDLVINAGGSGNIPLNFLNHWSTTISKISYSLCGKEGDKVEFDEKNKEWTINLKDLKKPIKLKGITFDPHYQEMHIDNLEIEPIEGITFPLDLNLNIKVSISDKCGLTVDHQKPIHIKITKPRLDEQQRTNCYNQFETKINETISKEYTGKKMENIENEIIREILYEGGDEAKIDKIRNDENKRNQFIQKIKNRLSVYLSSLTEDELKNGFKEHMTKEDSTLMNNENNPLTFKDLYNETNFQEYIENNWKDCLNDYVEEEVYKNLSKYQDIILSTFFGPQTISEGFSLNLNTIKNIFKKSENSNYTQFIIGKSHESKDNECKINNTETQKYSVKTEIKGANSITATIQIDTNNFKTITAKNHDELIEEILKQPDLHEKLRCDIALSVLKSIIAICPTATISRKIQNQNFSDGTKEIIGNTIKVITENGNLKLCAYKISSESKKAGRDNIIDSVDFFDERNYKDKYDENSINELKKGIFQISSEINIAMNSLTQDFQDTIYGKKKSLLKYSIPKHFKGRDIKRWIGKTDNNFNFDTEIDDLEGKKIRISLNQGKFTVSGIFNGKNYEFKNEDNLGNILNKKKDGKRIFDGIELKIINEINIKYIQELRKNKFISNKNYFVSDLGENRTGRIYILKPNGDLSYLETGNEGSKIFGNLETGTIKSNNIPTNIHICNDDEKREFFQNPILAGKLIKEMKKSLTIFSPKEASKEKTKKRKRRDSFKKMTFGNKIKFVGSIPRIWTSRIMNSRIMNSKIMNKIHTKQEPGYSVDLRNLERDIKEINKKEIKMTLLRRERRRIQDTHKRNILIDFILKTRKEKLKEKFKEKLIEQEKLHIKEGYKNNILEEIINKKCKEKLREKLKEKFFEKIRVNIWKIMGNKNKAFFMSDLDGRGKIYVLKSDGLRYLEKGKEGSEKFKNSDAGIIESHNIPQNLTKCSTEEQEYFDNDKNKNLQEKFNKQVKNETEKIIEKIATDIEAQKERPQIAVENGIDITEDEIKEIKEDVETKIRTEMTIAESEAERQAEEKAEAEIAAGTDAEKQAERNAKKEAEKEAEATTEELIEEIKKGYIVPTKIARETGINITEVETKIREAERRAEEKAEAEIATGSKAEKQVEANAEKEAKAKTKELLFENKIIRDLYATADYLNGEWKNRKQRLKACKKYLKALGVSLDGTNDGQIIYEAQKRSEMYKKYLKNNNP